MLCVQSKHRKAGAVCAEPAMACAAPGGNWHCTEPPQAAHFSGSSCMRDTCTYLRRMKLLPEKWAAWRG